MNQDDGQVVAGENATVDAADDTAALLAELQAEQAAGGDAGAKPAAKSGAAKPKAKSDPDEEPDPDEDPEHDEEPEHDEDDPDEEPEHDEDDPDEDEDPDPDDDAAKDPELGKRLAAVRQTEQRHRAALERDRAALERDRAAWQAEARQAGEEVQRFKSLAARVKYNPTAVLRALGVTEDELEGAAQHIVANSKAPGVTPAHRAAAERAMREREFEDKLAANEKELKALREGLSGREEQVRADAIIDDLLTRAARVAKSDKLEAPLVKARMSANPKATRGALLATAFRLAKQSGELPKPVAIIRAHEKELARLRSELGVDPPAAASGKPTGKLAKAAAVTGKSKAGAVKSVEVEDTSISHPTRDQLLRELKAGAAEA